MVDIFTPGYKSKLTDSDPTIDALTDTLSGLGDDALNALHAVVTGGKTAVDAIRGTTPVAPRSLNADIDKTYQPAPDLDGKAFVNRTNVQAPDWMVPELAKAIPAGQSQFERTGQYFRESPEVVADIERRVKEARAAPSPMRASFRAQEAGGADVSDALGDYLGGHGPAKDSTTEPEAAGWFSKFMADVADPEKAWDIPLPTPARALPMVIEGGAQPPIVDITPMVKSGRASALRTGEPEPTPQAIADMLAEHEGKALLSPEEARKQATKATTWEKLRGGATYNQIAEDLPLLPHIPVLGELPATAALGLVNPLAGAAGVLAPAITGMAQEMGRSEKGQESGWLAQVANALMGGDDNIRPSELQQEGGTPFTAFEAGRFVPRAANAFGDAGGEAMAELFGYAQPPEHMTAEQAMADANARRAVPKGFRDWAGMPKTGAEKERDSNWLADAIEGLGNFGGNVADMAHGLATIPTAVREALTNKPTAAAQVQAATSMATDFAREGFIKPLVAGYYAGPAGLLANEADRNWGRKVAREHPLDVAMAGAGALHGAAGVLQVAKTLRGAVSGAPKPVVAAADGAINAAVDVAQTRPVALPTVAKGIGTIVANTVASQFQGPTVAAYDLLQTAIKLMGWDVQGVKRSGQLPALARQWLTSPSSFIPAQLRNYLTQTRHSLHSYAEMLHRATRDLTDEQARNIDRAISDHPDNDVPITEFGSIPSGLLLEDKGAADARRTEAAKPSFVAGGEPTVPEAVWNGTVTPEHRDTLAQTKAIGRQFDDVVKAQHPAFRAALKREWDALPESQVASSVEALFSDAPATRSSEVAWGVDKTRVQNPGIRYERETLNFPGGKAPVETVTITEEPVDLGTAEPLATAQGRVAATEAERQRAGSRAEDAGLAADQMEPAVDAARAERDARAAFSALTHAINSAKWAMKHIDANAPGAAARFKAVADRLQKTADAHKVVLPLSRSQMARVASLEVELPKVMQSKFGGRMDLEAAQRLRKDALTELGRLRVEAADAKKLGKPLAADYAQRKAAATRMYDEATGKAGVDDVKAQQQQLVDMVDAMRERMNELSDDLQFWRPERQKVKAEFGEGPVNLNELRQTSAQEAADSGRSRRNRLNEMRRLEQRVQKQEALAAKYDTEAAAQGVTPAAAARYRQLADAARAQATEAKKGLRSWDEAVGPAFASVWGGPPSGVRRGPVKSVEPAMQEVRRTYSEQPRVVLDRIVRRLEGRTDELSVAHAIADEGLSPDMRIDRVPDMPLPVSAEGGQMGPEYPANRRVTMTLADAITRAITSATRDPAVLTRDRNVALDRIAHELEAQAPKPTPLREQGADTTATPGYHNPLLGLDVQESLRSTSREAARGDYTKGELPVDVAADIVRTAGKPAEVQQALAQRGVLVTVEQVAQAKALPGVGFKPEGAPRIPTDTRINVPLRNGKTPADIIAELKGMGRDPKDIHAALWAEGWPRPKNENKRLRAEAVADQRRWIEDVYAGRKGVDTPGRDYAAPNLSRFPMERQLEANEVEALRPPPVELDEWGRVMGADKSRPTLPTEPVIKPPDEAVRQAHKAIAAEQKDGYVPGLTVDESGNVIVRPDVRTLLEHAAKTADPMIADQAKRRLEALELSATAALPGKTVLQMMMALTGEAKRLGDQPLNADAAAALERIDADIAAKKAELTPHNLKVALWEQRRLEAKSVGRENAHLPDKNIQQHIDAKAKLEAEIAGLIEQRKPHLRQPMLYSPESTPSTYTPDVYPDAGVVARTMEKFFQNVTDGVARAKDAELFNRVAEARKKLTTDVGTLYDEASVGKRAAVVTTTQGAMSGPLMRNRLKALGARVDVRNAFGRVQDVRVSMPQRLGQLAKSIATMKMATEVVNHGRNPTDWTMRVMTPQEHALLPENQRSQWKLMPDDAMGYHQNGDPWATKKWGDLAGKYVHSDVHYMLVAMEQMAESMPLLTDLVNMGKSAKTIYNLAGHLRNLWANVFVFAPMMGINPFNPANWRYYHQALGDLIGREKSPWYWESYRSGTVDPNFTSAELGMRGAHATAQGFFGEMEHLGRNMKEMLSKPKDFTVVQRNKAGEVMGQIHQGLGVTYQFMDDVFRHAAWLKEMEQRGYVTPLRPGETPDQARIDAGAAAAEHVRNGTVNYTDTSKLVQVIAKPHVGANLMSAALGKHRGGAGLGAALGTIGWLLYGKQFFTFQAKAVPLIIEGVRRRPMESALFQAAGDASNYAMALDAGIDRDQLEAVMRNRPQRYKNARISSIQRGDDGQPSVTLRPYDEANIGYSDLDVLSDVHSKSAMDTLGSVLGTNFIGAPIKTAFTGKTPLGQNAWDEATVGADDDSIARFFRTAIQGFAPMMYPTDIIGPLGGEGSVLESYFSQQMDAANKGVPDAQGRERTPDQVWSRFLLGDKTATEPWNELVASGVQNFAQELAHDAAAIEKKYMRPLRLEKEFRDAITEESPGGLVADKQRAMDRELRVNTYALIDKYQRQLKGVPLDDLGDGTLLDYLAVAKQVLDSGEASAKEVRDALADVAKETLESSRAARALRLLDAPGTANHGIGKYDRTTGAKRPDDRTFHDFYDALYRELPVE